MPRIGRTFTESETIPGNERVVIITNGLWLGMMSMPALEWLGARQLPKANQIAIDGTMLLFALACVIIMGLIFGIVPSLHVMKENLGDMLHQSGWTGASGRSESVTRSSLAVAEISLAFMLLNGAGLLMASFLQILSVEPGFDPKNVITARLSLPARRATRVNVVSALRYE